MAFLGSGCRRATAPLAVAILATTGCSWIFVNRPPPEPVPAKPPVECTSSVLPPVVDTAGAVLLGLVGVGTILAGAGACTATTNDAWDNFFCVSAGERTVIIVSGLAITGVATALGFSAAHGYSTTGECRQLKEEQLSCVSGVEAACRSLEVRRP